MFVIRVLVLTLLVALLSVRPSAAQSTVRGGLPLTPESTLNRSGLTRRWWGHATINSSRDKLLYMTVDEGYLFLQSSAGVMTAFDAESGKRLWARPVGPPDRAIYPATINDELLFVVSGLNMYALRKTNGEIVWEMALPGQPSSSPAADDQRVFVGFLDGSLYAFDLKRIREVYLTGATANASPETVVWRYRTSMPIAIPAVPEGKLVAFASGNGSLYSVSAEDRHLIFQFETDAALSAPIVLYKRNLILASEDSNVYSLQLTSGKPHWLFTTGVVIRKAPVLIDDEVYLIPEHGNLFKLSAETGVEAWSHPRIRAFLSASSKHLFAVDENQNLVVLSRSTGKRLSSLPLGRFTMSLTNDRSDRIYVATEGGLVMCLHEMGREFPRFHLHPERQPVLPDFAPEGYEAESSPSPDAAANPDDLPPSDAPSEPGEGAPEPDEM